MDAKGSYPNRRNMVQNRLTTICCRIKPFLALKQVVTCGTLWNLIANGKPIADTITRWLYRSTICRNKNA